MWLEGGLVAASAMLTYAVRAFARRRALVDMPNERSSHMVPTPHGGGIAVLITFYAALTVQYLSEAIAPDLFMALWCAVPVAIVSLIDDLRPLPAKLRLVVQGVCALAALTALGGVDRVDIGFAAVDGIWLNVIAWISIVWLTNLFNFIDGIDGYAGTQTLFVGLSAWLLFGSEAGVLLAASAAGFLFFNWHKASIFMGDVGSAPLGFIFGVLALYDASASSFLGWVVLLSLFWFDATVTLWRRWRNGESLAQAHKKHAYQRLHQSGVPHDGVVWCGMGINAVLFILLLMMPQERYDIVFLIALALLWLAMKYVDTKKAFV